MDSLMPVAGSMAPPATIGVTGAGSGGGLLATAAGLL
jgi:hypothetical protein